MIKNFFPILYFYKRKKMVYEYTTYILSCMCTSVCILTFISLWIYKLCMHMFIHKQGMHAKKVNDLL